MGLDRHDNQETDLPKGLSNPALRALANAGLFTLEQVSTISEAELKNMHGIGPKAVELLRTTLETNGLTFANEGEK